MWKSSDGPVPLAQGDWSHAPPLPPLPLPTQKKFPIFSSKAPFYRIPETWKALCRYDTKSGVYLIFQQLSQKWKCTIERDSSIKNSYLSFL